MKTAIVSVSFNNFDNNHLWETQDADIFRYTEDNFPLRRSMTPHMQSKIPKMFGWQMNPGYDFYIYVDACYKLFTGFTTWLLSELEEMDVVVFPHPKRKTIAQEYQYLKVTHSSYDLQRYDKELLEEQYKVISDDKEYVDDLLLHAAIFAYRNNEMTKKMLKKWWYYVSRYHLCDQLSFPYVLKESNCAYKVINKKIKEVTYVEYVPHN